MLKPYKNNLTRKILTAKLRRIKNQKASRLKRRVTDDVKDFLIKTSKSINAFRLPILTVDALRQQLGGCSYNTVAKLPIPRKHLYPGCRRYVFMVSDVIKYFQSQASDLDIDLEL